MCSSLLTGSSPCHGFTQVAGNTGGFYHMVCRHGVSIINVQFLFIYWGTQYFLHVENAASFFPFLFIVLLLLGGEGYNSSVSVSVSAHSKSCIAWTYSGERSWCFLWYIFFQTTVVLKFLLLQESVRDEVDLYLFPPVVLVNDRPCGFARHLDLREPNVGNELWGDCMGCFENPSPDTDPMQVKDSSNFIPWFSISNIYLNSEYTRTKHFIKDVTVSHLIQCIGYRPKHFLYISIISTFYFQGKHPWSGSSRVQLH